MTIIRGSVDNIQAGKSRITIMMEDKTQREAEIEIATLSDFQELKGLVVLTNKSYGNEDLAIKLKDRTGRSPLILLQNGLGVERPFVSNNFKEIYRCVLFATAQALDEHRVRYKPVAVSPVGTIKVQGTDLAGVVDVMNTPEFRFRTEERIQEVIWTKAIINCVFNSICPLIETDNGIFHRDPSVLGIARQVIEEGTAVAQAMGLPLVASEIESQLLLISRKSDGQFISTFQDIRNRRRTEIDTLNFEIVSIAKTLAKRSEVQKIEILGELVRLKSDLSRS